MATLLLLLVKMFDPAGSTRVSYAKGKNFTFQPSWIFVENEKV